jgi:hypothetical protein
MTDPISANDRVLYVGDRVSWDTQWAHAVNLFNEGYTVWIHDHQTGERCRLDGARSKCGQLKQLTDGDDGPTLVLVARNEDTTE